MLFHGLRMTICGKVLFEIQPRGAIRENTHEKCCFDGTSNKTLQIEDILRHVNWFLMMFGVTFVGTSAIALTN